MKLTYYQKKDRELAAKQRALDVRINKIHREAAQVQDLPMPNILDRAVGFFAPKRMVERITHLPLYTPTG